VSAYFYALMAEMEEIMYILYALLASFLWLLESICVNFGCADYLQAIFVLAMLIGANYWCWIGIRLFASRLASWLTHHILALQWLDETAICKVQTIKVSVLSFVARLLTSLYESIMWEINHSRKKASRRGYFADVRAARIRKEMKRK